MRTELMRNEVTRLVRQGPFRPFIITMRDGTPILIGHPENIAFDPVKLALAQGRETYVITGGMRVYGTFDSISNITLRDVNGLIDSQGPAASSTPG